MSLTLIFGREKRPPEISLRTQASGCYAPINVKPGEGGSGLPRRFDCEVCPQGSDFEHTLCPPDRDFDRTWSSFKGHSTTFTWWELCLILLSRGWGIWIIQKNLRKCRNPHPCSNLLLNPPPPLPAGSRALHWYIDSRSCPRLTNRDVWPFIQNIT